VASGANGSNGRAPHGSADVHDESWISLVGLRRELLSGKNDLAGMIVLGLALDRLEAGPVHRIADRSDRPAAIEISERASPLRKSFPPDLARECVTAALRSAGLGLDDDRIDAIVGRARASALLPETRLRAMRLWDDANHTTTLATTDGTNYYDAVGANLVLEARLTWRLDRLVYAGDEPTLERVRLERQEARARVASRTLEALFAWERATLDANVTDATGTAGAVGTVGAVGTGGTTETSREALEVELRRAEARASLDVLTGGWFSSWVDGQASSPRSP
jgi:hypothetical protein